jgi:hypothetical protein
MRSLLQVLALGGLIVVGSIALTGCGSKSTGAGKMDNMSSDKMGADKMSGDKMDKMSDDKSK